MPVRPRGDSWQLDIRLMDGSRLRRTYPTEAAALEAEQQLRPTPQQRAAFRAKKRQSSRQSSARKGTKPSGSISRSGKQFSRSPEGSGPPRSNLITLRPSPPSSPANTQPPDTPNSQSSERGCDGSAPEPRQSDCPTIPHPGREKSPSESSTSSGFFERLAQAANSHSCSPTKPGSETKPSED